MKNLLAIILVSSVGLIAGCNQNNSSSSQADMGELGKLKAQLAEANARPVKESSEQALQKLAILDPQPSKTRVRAVRQILQHLENLSDAGKEAVQPIVEFMKKGNDMNYVFDEPHGNISMWNWHPGQQIHPGLVLPPTLRLALVDDLKYIGGTDAEAGLSASLMNTKRAVELAYISEVLEEMAPGKYTSVATEAAKKLLADGSAIKSGSSLDMNSDAYLYGLLGTHGDTSAVVMAEANLVKDNHLDANAASYLVSSLKEQAVPVLAKIYKDANGVDKNTIASLTLHYVGTSADANQIFKDWVMNNGLDANSQTLVGRPRAMALAMLANTSDPDVISGRVQLLTELVPQVTEPHLKQVFDKTLQTLTAKLSK